MDRARLYDYLAGAENRLSDCSLRISYQEYLIAGLTRDGQDTGPAETALANLRRAKQTHWEYRARLLSKIHADEDSVRRQAP